MLIRTLCLPLLALLFLLSCRTDPSTVSEDATAQDSADDRTAIRELIRTQTGAINRRDIDAVLNCLHPSAVYMPSGEARVEGREAVREALVALFSRAEVTVSYQSQEIEVVGVRAFERGQFVRSTLRREDGTTSVVNGSTVRVLARDTDGSWRIFREIWAIHPTQE